MLKEIEGERYITALVLSLVALIAIFSDSLFVMWVFLGIVYLFAFHESCKIFAVENNAVYLFALLLWIVLPFYAMPLELVILILALIVSYFAYVNRMDIKPILPFLYPTISFVLLFELYKLEGYMAIFWLVAVVAFTDIFAFFGGKAIGHQKFSSSSPNKTIEGVIVGVVFGSVVGSLVGFFMLDSILLALVISIFVSLFSVFGDLFESHLKRVADIKDSGSILPGHGGVLDRVDGYLFGVIALSISLRIFA